ncbi:MAG TPA: hypothetical protein VMU56_07870 [Beijerinckiaceae bacterium]|nr:hypothetical protein [Beijerinckiaceae bacterium]
MASIAAVPTAIPDGSFQLRGHRGPGAHHLTAMMFNEERVDALWLHAGRLRFLWNVFGFVRLRNSCACVKMQSRAACAWRGARYRTRRQFLNPLSSKADCFDQRMAALGASRLHALNERARRISLSQNCSSFAYNI